GHLPRRNRTAYPAGTAGGDRGLRAFETAAHRGAPREHRLLLGAGPRRRLRGAQDRARRLTGDNQWPLTPSPIIPTTSWSSAPAARGSGPPSAWPSRD